MSGSDERGIRATMTTRQRWQHDELRHRARTGTIHRQDNARRELAQFERRMEAQQAASGRGTRVATQEQMERWKREARTRGTIGEGGAIVLPPLRGIDGTGSSHRASSYERIDSRQLRRDYSARAVAGQYGLVAGNGGKARCPKCGKPELMIYDDHVHCYTASCRVWWDVAQIVMHYESVDFPDAVRILKGEGPRGSSEPRKLAPVPAVVEQPEQRPQLDRDALVAAARDAFWAQETEAAQAAMDHLLSRGFDGDDLEMMGVGVIDRSVPRELLPLNREGRPSRMWCDRVIIPGYDDEGRCVSIKGRTLQPEPVDNSDGFWRKYLNVAGSSTRPYGWSEAVVNSVQRVILTEGELDYWTLRVLFPDELVIAVPGLSNLNETFAALLAGREVVVLVDGDTQLLRSMTGDWKGLGNDELKSAALEAGLKPGPVVAARGLVQRLTAAGARVSVAATGLDGDLNDILRSNIDDRETARQIISQALSSAVSLSKRRALR